MAKPGLQPSRWVSQFEKRCREAFEKEIVSQIPWYDEAWASDLAWWMGWKHCWRYLERNAFSEFIEK